MPLCFIPSSRTPEFDQYRSGMVAGSILDESGMPVMIGLTFIEKETAEGVFWPLDIIHVVFPFDERGCIMRCRGREQRIVIAAECSAGSSVHYHFRVADRGDDQCEDDQKKEQGECVCC